MRPIFLFALARAFAPSVMAHAGTPQKPLPPIDLSNYTAELVQKPEYSTAYHSMATLPAWVRTGQGTSTPTTLQTLKGKLYRVGHLCEPHNCAQNQFDVILSENGKQAWGLFSSRRGTALYQMPFGDPDEDMLTALLAAYRANNP